MYFPLMHRGKEFAFHNRFIWFLKEWYRLYIIYSSFDGMLLEILQLFDTRLLLHWRCLSDFMFTPSKCTLLIIRYINYDIPTNVHYWLYDITTYLQMYLTHNTILRHTYKCTLLIIRYYDIPTNVHYWLYDITTYLQMYMTDYTIY